MFFHKSVKESLMGWPSSRVRVLRSGYGGMILPSKICRKHCLVSSEVHVQVYYYWTKCFSTSYILCLFLIKLDGQFQNAYIGFSVSVPLEKLNNSQEVILPYAMLNTSTSLRFFMDFEKLRQQWSLLKHLPFFLFFFFSNSFKKILMLSNSCLIFSISLTWKLL